MRSKVLLVVLLLCSAANSQIRWQTTRDGRTVSNCLLESSRITVTVHNFHIDVEEEALITTTGSVPRGDPNTLEIFGEFTLSPGSAVRSMLLWNGDIILKAKLLIKADAEREYEEVVDRDLPNVVIIDPALIEYLGNNRYSFKIYPVEMNGTRKIRILYTIPMQATPIGPRFDIRTAFSGIVNLSTQRPSTIPVEFKYESTAYDSYIFEHGSTKRTIEPNAVYQIPSQYIFNSTLKLFPDKEDFTAAFVRRIEEGDGEGHYAAIFTSVPDSVKNAVREEVIVSGSTVEIKVNTEEKAYITDLQMMGSFGIYLKTATPWDSILTWNAYDEEGRVIFTYDQNIEPDTLNSEMLPLIWGAKYSLQERQGNLGAIYGFVDNEMSLLALERDSMSREDMELYAEGGVPPLEPEEIIIKPEKMPSAPREFIIFEQTGIINSISSALVFRVSYLPDGRIMLHFGENLPGMINATLFDAKGRVVKSWKRVNADTRTLELSMPRTLKGVYFLKIESGKEVFKSKVILH